MSKAKFKVGDNVEFIINGTKGEIVKVEPSHVVVRWEDGIIGGFDERYFGALIPVGKVKK